MNNGILARKVPIVSGDIPRVRYRGSFASYWEDPGRKLIVIVYGGQALNKLSDVFMLTVDFVLDRWTWSKPNVSGSVFPPPCSNHRAICFNSQGGWKMLSFGGTVDEGSMNVSALNPYVLDLKYFNWKRVYSTCGITSPPRDSFSMVSGFKSDNACVFLFGGRCMPDNKLFNDLWILDTNKADFSTSLSSSISISGFEWVKMGNSSLVSPSPREKAGIVQVDENGRYVYVFGGICKGALLSDELWQFDLEKGKWKLLENSGYSPDGYASEGSWLLRIPSFFSKIDFLGFFNFQKNRFHFFDIFLMQWSVTNLFSPSIQLPYPELWGSCAIPPCKDCSSVSLVFSGRDIIQLRTSVAEGEDFFARPLPSEGLVSNQQDLEVLEELLTITKKALIEKESEIFDFQARNFSMKEMVEQLRESLKEKEEIIAGEKESLELNFASLRDAHIRICKQSQVISTVSEISHILKKREDYYKNVISKCKEFFNVTEKALSPISINAFPKDFISQKDSFNEALLSLREALDWQGSPLSLQREQFLWENLKDKRN